MYHYVDPEKFQSGTPQWRMATEQYRNWLGEQLYADAANQGVDINDKTALAQLLNRYGATPERGGGAHTYNLFMGNLANTEGNGLTRYEPAWARMGEAPPADVMSQGPQAGMDEASQRALSQRFGGHTLGSLMTSSGASGMRWPGAAGSFGSFNYGGSDV
jgi:hypothetical protein